MAAQPVVGKPCPACGHPNRPEADTCLFCGAPLEATVSSPESSTVNVEARGAPAGPPEPLDVPPPARGLAIYLNESSQPVAILYEDEFILGRLDTKQKPPTDTLLVDLAPYGAREMGVSRQHLLIRRSAGGYEAIDLGSANGTYLYEERMRPHQPYPLHHGVFLRLGNLHLFLTFRFSGQD
ncbi:MAG: FHA domain-containing protein [Anaerolineales bacterium]